MAVCQYCNQEMLSGVSCSVKALHRQGVAYTLPRYGEEIGWGRPTGRCHDCGAPPGAYHHLGCDVAECPYCRRQLITCGCRFDEDGEVEDEDEWGVA